MTPSPLWTNADSLSQFDLSMTGAEAALGRLQHDKPYDNQLTYMEVLFWLGAAIDSMKLQEHHPDTIYAGIHWVRNKAAHHQAKLMKLTPGYRWDEAQYDEARYDDWYFESPEAIGVGYDNTRGTPVSGYVKNLEGKSVRMYLLIGYNELHELSEAMRHQ